MSENKKTRATDATNARVHKSRTTPPRNWRKVFLSELAIDGNRRRAAEAAHVDHATVYRHRVDNPEFRAAWDAAIDQASEYLEGEAWRRATEGVDEPAMCAKGLVYDEDGRVVMLRKYSDSLMALLLKGARPQKYRENVSVTAPAALGVTVVLEQIEHDSGYAEHANELVRLITAAGTTEAARGDE